MSHPQEPLIEYAADSHHAASGSVADRWRGLLRTQPWISYVLPLAVFMLVGTLEPTPGAANNPAGASDDWFSIDYSWYPAVYCTKILLTLLAMWLVRDVYRQYPWRLSRWAVPMGVLGAGVWIGICQLELEKAFVDLLGLQAFSGLGARSSYNPFAELAGNPAAAGGMMAVRLFGLAIVVPVIEEFFLRGFLLRYVVHPNWESVPFGQVNGWAIATGTILPMLMHPQEMLAAAVWFSAITWLMCRTRNIWDCVVAHAVTNLVLGGYVICTGEWQLL